jgi:hypothetical protein
LYHSDTILLGGGCGTTQMKEGNREQRNEAMKWKQKKCGKIKEHPNIYH